MRGQDFESHYENFIVMYYCPTKAGRRQENTGQRESWGERRNKPLSNEGSRGHLLGKNKKGLKYKKPRWQFDIDAEIQLVTKRKYQCQACFYKRLGGKSLKAMSTGKQEQCVGKFRRIFPGKHLGVRILNVSGHMQKEGLMKTLQMYHCCTAQMVVFTEITFFVAAF